MIHFVANITLLFTEFPLLERFQRAADAGFRRVELWSPIEADPRDLVRAKDEAGIELLQFNLDPGDLAAGDRGLLGIPDFQKRFRSGADLVLQLARLYNVRQVMCLAGNRVDELSREDQLACMRDNLTWFHPLLEEHNLHMNIEFVSRFHSPRYFFAHSRDLFSFIRELDLPRIGVQYDLFHAQMMEGNLVATLRENLPLIGHIQIADLPDRNPPGSGEINYRHVLAEIEAMGYEKFIGLEYNPSGSTEASLAWLPNDCRVSATADALRL